MAAQQIKYGLWVLVSSALMITGHLWYDQTNRPNPTPRGEDVAELVSSDQEHIMAALRGLEVPSLNINPIITTNTYLKTNYTATVTCERVSDPKHIRQLPPTSLTFSDENNSYTNSQAFNFAANLNFEGVNGEDQWLLKKNGSADPYISGGTTYGWSFYFLSSSGPDVIFGTEFTGLYLTWSPWGSQRHVPTSPNQTNFFYVTVSLKEKPTAANGGTLVTTPIHTIHTNYNKDIYISPVMSWRHFENAYKDLRNAAVAKEYAGWGFGNYVPDPYHSAKDGIWWLDNEYATMWNIHWMAQNDRIGFRTYDYRKETNTWYSGQKETDFMDSENSIFSGARPYMVTNGLVYTPTNCRSQALFFTTDTVLKNQFTSPQVNFYDYLFSTPVYPTNAIGDVLNFPTAKFIYRDDEQYDIGDWPVGEQYIYNSQILTSQIFGGTGSWWVAKGFHTNTVWQYKNFELIYTNVSTSVNGGITNYNVTTNLYTDRTMSTNKFNTMRTLSEKLNSTIAVAHVLKDTNTIMETFSYTKVVTNGTYSDASSLLALYGTLFTNSYSSVTSPTPTVIFIGGQSASEYFRSLHTDWTLVDEKYGINTSGSSDDNFGEVGSLDAGPSSYCIYLQNAVLDYPSAFAITNDLVSRVRVYAVFEYTPWSAGIGGMPYNVTVTNSGGSVEEDNIFTNVTTTTINVLSTDLTLPSDGYDKTLGLKNPRNNTDIKLSSHQEPFDFVVSSTRHDRGDFRTVAIFANLILDVSNPDSLDDLRFSIGKRDILPISSIGEYPQKDSYSVTIHTVNTVYYNSGEKSVYTGDTEQEHQRYYFLQEIFLTKFLVVVDWKFKHMQSTPFVPSPLNDPLWTKPYTTNAP